MRVLIKVGGTLLDEAEPRERISRQLAEASRSGVRLVVVHGGGRQMTRYLAERGVESRFVNGLRVTTPEVLDAVLKVFAGTVNHQFVAALNAAGARAVGLSGIDALLAEAEPLAEELGTVGRVTASDGSLLETLTEAGYLPVVACVAGDRRGNIYNVNADQMAVACAAGFHADRLFFLTDVDGVRDAAGQTLRRLDWEGAERLIRDGVATGGMQAKLNAAGEALRRGVGEIVIAPGAEDGIIARLLAGDAAGTRLVA